MLKCRHLRVRVRAPKAAVMRKRELALLPVRATTSSGPSSFASRNAGSAGGKDKEDREEDEDEDEDEGQGDNKEREEDEQPPPPPENTMKKDLRKKSKRGRKSR
jgi:hypothetical protein